MAEIIPLQVRCQMGAPNASVSWREGLRDWFARLPWQRRRDRIGNADELPDHLRRDMGLAPHPAEPGRHYADYLPSTRA